MIMNRLLLLLLLLPCFTNAQDFSEPNAVIDTSITTKLKDVFLRGRLSVHARSVFMNTINEGSLKDDYALAAGVGIGLTTKPFHGLQAGISTFVVNNIFSSHLEKPDPTTGMSNRYEIGLYDMENPGVRNNLVRIENFYLRYMLSKSSLTIGKMMLNTPFLNPQDGRMNATMEAGVWLTMEQNKTIHLYGGWLWGISPRSTIQWLSVANSFGLYPPGVTTTGVRSGYEGNMHTAGIALANVTVAASKKIKLSLWDMFIDNVMNTSMIEVNTTFGKKLYQGVMFIHQDAINNGGNADAAKAYIDKGAQSNIISVQVGMKTKKMNANVNATRITGDGRYLSPREWGRDPFYTFMPREKNDGFGNLLALSTNVTYTLLQQLKAGIGYGYFHLPDVKDYRLNKYGMPSYHQLNTTISYSFTGTLQGLEVRFLGAYKMRQGAVYNNPKFIYNKVNMANLNLILDFRM